MANYGDNGYIDFTKMWDLMDRVHLKKKYLRENGIHTNTIAKLTKNENITTEVISHLCLLLKCQPGDIMEYVPPKHQDSLTG